MLFSHQNTISCVVILLWIKKDCIMSINLKFNIKKLLLLLVKYKTVLLKDLLLADVYPGLSLKVACFYLVLDEIICM